MNYIDVFLFVIIAVSIYVGYRKGLVVSLLDVICYVAGIPVSLYVSSKYNTLIYDSYVQQTVIEKLTQKIDSSANFDAFVSSVTDSINALPQFIAGQLDTSALNNLTNEKAVSYIEANVAKPIALIIIEVILFIAVFAVFAIVTSLVKDIFKSLNRKKHIPFSRTNRFLGGVFGAVKAGAVLMIIGAVVNYVTAAMPNENTNKFFSQLNSSAVIEYINEFNPLI